MKHLEITVITTTAASEIAAEILSEAGSSGVSIIDKSDFLQLAKEKAAWDYVESGLLESMGGFARVSGYFDVKREKITVKRLNERFEKLKAGDYGINFGPLEIITRVLDDNDWIDLWKKHFKPITIKGITIVPEWLAGNLHRPRQEVCAGTPSCRRGIAARAEKKVILNPGMAFGTGEHETTAGCIELLQSISLRGKSVIDLGCGSGILGITAAVLGAESVTMIDIDPLAVKASNINVNLNVKENPDATAKITVTEGNLFEKADLKADIIVANLASDLLISAAKEIAAHLEPQGALILSGIINARANEVVKAYESILGKGAVKEILHRGEWVALLMRDTV